MCMCAWTGVVFGAKRRQSRGRRGALNLLQFPTLNHQCQITAGAGSNAGAVAGILAGNEKAKIVLIQQHFTFVGQFGGPKPRCGLA